MKIIAFGHRKQVGKDTCCKYLISELRMTRPGVSIIKAGFADKIKDVAYQLFWWAGLQPGDYYEHEDTQHLKEVVLEKIGKTPRQLWIGIGNGIREATGYDDTWGVYLFEQMKQANCSYLFIKDLRFPAEAELIKKYGGKVYRVDNPRKEKVTDGADDPLENYKGWDGVVLNNGTLKDLHTKLIDDIYWEI